MDSRLADRITVNLRTKDTGYPWTELLGGNIIAYK